MGKILAVCISERNSKDKYKRGTINRKLWS